MPEGERGYSWRCDFEKCPRAGVSGPSSRLSVAGPTLSAIVIHYYLGGMAFARAGALDAVSSVEAWTLAIAGGATIAGQ